MERLYVTISTDGSCKGNPGPGGYAGVLRFGQHKKNIAGYGERTTNNRMEIKAVIEAVRILKKPCDITLRVDSSYVLNGVKDMFTLEERHWIKSSGAKYANADLWQELVNISKSNNHVFQCVKVDAHSGDPDNEECDRLAKEQILLHS